MGFQKRTIANDYNGKFELFYDEVIILDKLHLILPTDIKVHKYLLAAREKLTQLLIAGVTLDKHIELAENQTKNINNPKYNLSSSYFSLINEVEFYLYKLVSLLDILSKLAAYFYKLKENKKIKDSYGKQKSFNYQKNTFKNQFDITYQKRLLKNNVINSLHLYRNEFTHDASLKIIPWKRQKNVTLIITKGDKKGLKIRVAIEKSFGELKRFISFYEKYFIAYLRNSP